MQHNYVVCRGEVLAVPLYRAIEGNALWNLPAGKDWLVLLGGNRPTISRSYGPNRRGAEHAEDERTETTIAQTQCPSSQVLTNR